MTHDTARTLQRRSFLSRFGAGAAAFTAAFGTQSVTAQPPARWEPIRHPEDDWFEQIPGKHRFFYDSATPNGAAEAITFATNYYVASRSGYSLVDSDLAVVICLRHWSTPFAWNDAVWAKYGKPISDRIKFSDPKTQAAPTVNALQSTQYGMQLPNRGTTLDAMIKRGTHFAICDMATRAFAGVIATATSGKPDEIYQELKANSIGNAHYVSAGIVAVNRAQERGYSLCQLG
jgi:intracellular sulfur oxidation DsrE/DsrF family protein